MLWATGEVFVTVNGEWDSSFVPALGQAMAADHGSSLVQELVPAVGLRSGSLILFNLGSRLSCLPFVLSPARCYLACQLACARADGFRLRRQPHGSTGLLHWTWRR